MATDYTHAVVGVGLAGLYACRPMPWAYWGLAAVLPIIPDLDVFSMAAYGSSLGHRGIAHSLLFALLLSIVAASATFRYFGARWWSLAALFFAIIASHGLLDAFTYGGEGIPFLYGRPMVATATGDQSRFQTSPLACRTQGTAKRCARRCFGCGSR